MDPFRPAPACQRDASWIDPIDTTLPMPMVGGVAIAAKMQTSTVTRLLGPLNSSGSSSIQKHSVPFRRIVEEGQQMTDNELAIRDLGFLTAWPSASRSRHGETLECEGLKDL